MSKAFIQASDERSVTVPGAGPPAEWISMSSRPKRSAARTTSSDAVRGSDTSPGSKATRSRPYRPTRRLRFLGGCTAVDDDLSTFAKDRFGDREADPARSAGDEGELVCDLVHLFVLAGGVAVEPLRPCRSGRCGSVMGLGCFSDAAEFGKGGAVSLQLWFGGLAGLPCTPSMGMARSEALVSRP